MIYTAIVVVVVVVVVVREYFPKLALKLIWQINLQKQSCLEWQLRQFWPLFDLDLWVTQGQNFTNFNWQENSLKQSCLEWKVWLFLPSFDFDLQGHSRSKFQKLQLTENLLKQSCLESKVIFIPPGLDSSPSQNDKKRLQTPTTQIGVISEAFKYLGQTAGLLDGFCSY